MVYFQPKHMPALSVLNKNKKKIKIFYSHHKSEFSPFEMSASLARFSSRFYLGSVYMSGSRHRQRDVCHKFLIRKGKGPKINNAHGGARVQTHKHAAQLLCRSLLNELQTRLSPTALNRERKMDALERR